MQAKERIYVTADRSEAVAEDDPRAALLLAAEGHDIAPEDAERYGLVAGRLGRRVVVPAPEPEAKAVEGPAENKARAGGSKK